MTKASRQALQKRHHHYAIHIRSVDMFGRKHREAPPFKAGRFTFRPNHFALNYFANFIFIRTPSAFQIFKFPKKWRIIQASF
jgi:hypothetical protein